MNRSSISDAELIRACLSGDARSWDTLIARYSSFIYALVTRMGLSAADADDVFQNVCLRLFQNLGDLRDLSRLSAWLASTTRREVWHLRRHRGTQLLGDLPEGSEELERAQPIGAESVPTLEEAIIALEEQYLVRRCLQQLPDECRKLLSMLYQEDAPCSYAEVARALSIPLGAIGPKRARCLMRLKKICDESGF